jgi:hypothetical protein
MEFLNKRTGNVIIVPCRIEGPDWEEVKGTKEVKAEPEAAPEKKPAAKRRTASKEPK